MRERVHRNARPDASKRPRSVVKLSTRRPGRIICFTKLSWPTNSTQLTLPYSSSPSIFLKLAGRDVLRDCLLRYDRCEKLRLESFQSIGPKAAVLDLMQWMDFRQETCA